MQNIDDLLLKYFTGENLSDKEKIQLDDWRNHSIGNEKVFEEIKKYWYHKKNTSEDSKRKVWKGLKKNILVTQPSIKNFEVKHKKDLTKRSLLVAASLIFILLYFIFPKNIDNLNKVEEITMISRKNKKGEKRTFHLSDGSFIKLNADSKISFPEKFLGDKREVFLEGEAFFDVKRDTARPFIVHSNKITTIVKGTSFNVDAYQAEEEIKVSVVTGMVEVVNNADQKKFTLQPKERAIYNHSNNRFDKSLFELNELVWKDGILAFTDADLEEVFKELERWYGVSFEIKNQSIYANEGYTGLFENETLKSVLQTISFAGKFEFEINENRVTIK